MLEVTVRRPAAAPDCPSGRLTLSGDAATIEHELSFHDGEASATLAEVPAGDWRSEVRCAAVIATGHAEVATAAAAITITGAARALVIDETAALVVDEVGFVAAPVRWTYDNEYSLVVDDRLQAVVRLPIDALDPSFELSTFDERWSYVYVDRAFYDTGSDGNQAFLLGARAFERYEDVAHVVDADDFVPLVAEMRDRSWTKADSFVVIIADDGEELLLLHEWRRAPPGAAR